MANPGDEFPGRLFDVEGEGVFGDFEGLQLGLQKSGGHVVVCSLVDPFCE